MSVPTRASLGLRLAEGLARMIHRRAGSILLIAALLTALATVLVTRLRIDQELRRLLPPEFSSVQRLNALSQRLGQQTDLFVTIRSPSRDANIAYGEALARQLEQRDDVRFVVFRRDLSFFEDRALLYASLGDLVDLRRRVIHRIREEVRKQAFGDFGATGGPAAPERLGLDVEGMKARYGLHDTASEFMEADDGTLMVVKVRPTQPSTDLAFAKRLSGETLALAESLDPRSFHPQMEISLDGAYVQHTGRLRSLQDDVLGGSVAAVTALLATLALYFRSGRSIALIFVPLLASVIGALAFAWLRFEVLNLVSAFIFAVLLGLGIDHGIHVLSRYRQELGRQVGSEVALARTLATTGWTTLAGGISTALAFAALIVADFQGFAQFGEVAAVGVLLSMVAALVVLPALVVALDRIRPWAPPSAASAASSNSRIPRSLKGIAIVLALAGTAIAVHGALNFGSITFEHDLRQLGPRRDEGAGEPKRATYRDAVGYAQTVDPVLALADSPEQALVIQRQLSALGAMTEDEARAFDPAAPPTRPLPEPPSDPLDEDPENVDEDLEDFGDEDLEDPRFLEIEALAVRDAVMSPEVAALLGRYGSQRLLEMKDRMQDAWSLASFVPAQQDVKLAIIRDIRARIDAKLGMLRPKTRAEIDEWKHYLAVDAPIGADDLPDWVKAQFEDKQGGVGRFVVIGTRGSKADILNASRIYAAFGDLHTPQGPVQTAADFYVIPEIFAAIERDGPYVMVLAIAVMVTTTVLLLRRLGAALAVVITLAFALLWLAAVVVGCGWKLNIFNIIVLPLLIGMGEDDALHIAERYYEEQGDLPRVLAEAGGPIFMTTITTVWGFAGILFANHRGLESMAWMAVVGMSLALLASVVVLPVLLELGRRIRQGP